MNIYFDDPQVEGEEVDCPKCGSEAIVNDTGIICSNPQCENYVGD